LVWILLKEYGQLGAEYGQLGAESGQLGAESGQLSAESGQLGAESGQLGAESGQIGGVGGTSLLCLACNQEKPLTEFDSVLVELWRKHHNLGRDARCTHCSLKHDDKKFRCKTCTKTLPASALNPTRLETWIRNKDTARKAICAKCSLTKEVLVRALPAWQQWLYTCSTCGKEKPPQEYETT
jgi:DNA-directed RNA polymerase subunit RPC12/RpoP